jgi:2-haloacid dehalogenase
MPDQVKALFYDVFGTLADYRTSIAREAEALLKPKGFALDWPAFADAWRGQYQPALEEVRSGRRPYTKLDILHRENLETVLQRFGVTGLSDDEKNRFTLGWHRLDAWPDVPEGLARLKNKFWQAPLSNGNISIMVDLARRNSFPWDAILGADIAQDFKPKPRVYLAAAAAFDLKPEQCMLVAAHSNDLAAAAAQGLRTAHVARPNEHGPGTGEAAPGVPVEYAVKSLVELAEKLGT